MDVPVGAGNWANENAMLLAVAWPLGLAVVFAGLALRRWMRLSR